MYQSVGNVRHKDVKMQRTTEKSRSDLEIHDDGLDQNEDGRVILPVDVGGGLTQFDASDGSALRQLLTATLAG